MLQGVMQGVLRRAEGLVGWLGRLAARAAAPQRGATTAEYAMILALVVIVLLTSLTALGSVLEDKLDEIVSRLTTAGQQP